ncbi:MAG: 16S rRNA processing protein RimM [Bacteroidia bacterium]|jgi:16S rRNA processing protein RimM
MILSTGPIAKIGDIVKTHGFDGRLKLIISTSSEYNLKEPIFIFFDNKPVPFFISNFSNSDPAIISIDDITEVEHAKVFVGKEVFQCIDEQADEEEFNLIGFMVNDEDDALIGIIMDVHEQAHHPLLIVQTTDHKEVMIPLVEEFIISLDHNSKTIHMDLPEGLLELE